MTIREIHQADTDQIWEIIEKVIAAGDTYAFDPAASRKDMIEYWLGKDKHGYVAVMDNKVVGTYIIKDNQPALGAHIANGSYMVHPSYHGKGIGQAMGVHSLEEAKRLGYRGMQFNIVVSTNKPAVRLWTKLGFQIIGTIPEGFKHAKLGFVDIHIMYKSI